MTSGLILATRSHDAPVQLRVEQAGELVEYLERWLEHGRLVRHAELPKDKTMSGEAARSWSIRPCSPDEASALLALWKQADATPSATDNAEAIQRVVQESSACVLVTEADGQLVGSIIGTFDGWRGNIYRLAVHPDYRRLGIARAMLAEIHIRLKNKGAKRITALVEKDHPRAIEFWQGVGYQLDHRMVRYIQDL